MQSAPFPPDEAARQRALDDLQLLDTPAEQEFDDITLLASFICDTPIALISLVDKDRQWFKSRIGLDVPQTPRDIAFCAYAILGDEMFEVQDAAADLRFADNPVVTGEPHLRFYAGIPLKTSDNQNVGTLCVIDREPRLLTIAQRAALKALGRQIMRLVELRKSTRLQAELRRQLAAETALTSAIIENAGAAIISTDLDAIIRTFNPAAEQMLGYRADEVIGKVSPVTLLHDPEEVAKRAAELSKHYGEEIAGLDIFLRPLRDAAADTSEWTYRCKDGKRIPVVITLSLLRDEAGKAFGYLGIIRDVTERHELETQQRLRFQSETLLKEIHHRVKNNMQVVSSLLSIQSSQLKDAAQRDVFLECRERIRAMSLIHDRLYSTGKYADIDFGDYLREMVSLITSSNRPAGAEVHIDLQVQPVDVPVETAVPLSLIASELVLNSLKHAFRGRREGTLTVRLTRESGTCRLFVGDDGPGMQPPDPSHTGVGLQLIEGLTKQIKARREIASGPGVGTTIIWEQ
ncbi:MAG: PAS domain S-box protein [Chthoniobacterales bacterium]|nr:PAS domain S-box protein [Chthoniobacterales bacterium]